MSILCSVHTTAKAQNYITAESNTITLVECVMLHWLDSCVTEIKNSIALFPLIKKMCLPNTCYLKTLSLSLKQASCFFLNWNIPISWYVITSFKNMRVLDQRDHNIIIPTRLRIHCLIKMQHGCFEPLDWLSKINCVLPNKIIGCIHRLQ